MKPVFFTVIAVLVLSAAIIVLRGFEEPKPVLVEVQRPLMGTLFTVKVHASDEGAAREAINRAFDEGFRLQKVLSARDAESELSAFNDAPAHVPYRLSKDLSSALGEGLEIAKATNGAYDPTLGRCIRLWHRAKSRKELPDEATLQAALNASGYDKIILDGNMATKTVDGLLVDLGGIGKGIAADRMGAILRHAGFPVFCISTTSDVLAGAPPPDSDGWLVCLNPEQPESERKMVTLSHTAVSTSGDEEQRMLINGRYYSHIINPLTGLGISSDFGTDRITIRAPRASTADALSTACRVSGAEKCGEILELFPGTSMISE